jgi:hypothetical protein
VQWERNEFSLATVPYLHVCVRRGEEREREGKGGKGRGQERDMQRDRGEQPDMHTTIRFDKVLRELML